MKVAGIDLSVRSVDIVLLADDNRADWTSVPCADRRGAFFAARLAAELMPRGTFWDDVYLVGVENPVGRFAHTQKALGMILGAVAGCLPRTLTAVLTRPDEWKRLTVGDAKADKQAVAQWAGGQWSNVPGMVTQDALDAYAIAYAVRELNAAAVGGADGAAA